MQYLVPFQDNCQFSQLLKIKQERDTWIERESANHYKKLLQSLPSISPCHLDLTQEAIIIDSSAPLSEQDKKMLETSLKQLIPWRKGPYRLFDQFIDAEWRSDLKWNRIAPFLPPLKDKIILDIGCNNGYFMFKMAAQNPRLLLGIDPVVHMQTQFQLIQHYAQIPNLYFELLGIEHLPLFNNLFDLILSMGIIYHHRNPIAQLLDIKNALCSGGTAIIETIGIPGEDSIALFPEDRYAQMKNIWFLPTLNCLTNWMKKAKFEDIKIIASSQLTPEEQRLTPWCPPPHQSLSDFLDKNDPRKTVEGHPAPMRFAIMGRKP